MKRCTDTAVMLLPAPQIDLERWAVVACDQYTSQPEYWEQAEQIVGEEPSTLRLTLPEVWLESSQAEKRMQGIATAMKEYQENGTLQPTQKGMMLVRRMIDGVARLGIVMAFDLEEYDYREGSTSKIRPTEKTVEERIPARLEIRRQASLELPHIMLLIDDPEHTVIKPIYESLQANQPTYHTSLMLGGGQITGWFLPQGQQTEQIQQALDALSNRERFEKRYGATANTPLVQFATGDGNHSMAAAKASWEEIRQTLTEEEKQTHPARWVLAEVVNLHDESLEIEPIHRAVFGADIQAVQQMATVFFEKQGGKAVWHTDIPKTINEWMIPCLYGRQTIWLEIQKSPWALPIAAVQAFLDAWQQQNPETRLDYIHGKDTVEQLVQQTNCIGFLLPDLEKQELFRGVVLDGVLPRKTFSMGRAQDKRYYMEARKIR